MAHEVHVSNATDKRVHKAQKYVIPNEYRTQGNKERLFDYALIQLKPLSYETSLKLGVDFKEGRVQLLTLARR